jgi:hypothetical protein
MDVEDTRRKPVGDFVQKYARQEKGIVKNGGGLEAFGYKPANFEDVLVQPTLKLAEQIE